MTFEDALQVLDIDVTASRKAVRRAYLTLIKVHKPDRDPEGFQRVRAAFELVNDQIEWRQMLAKSDDAIDESLEDESIEDESIEDMAPLAFDAASANHTPLEDGPADLPDFAAEAEGQSDPPEPADDVDDARLWSRHSPAASMRAALDAVEADAPQRAEHEALGAFEAARHDLNANPPSAYDALHVCLLLYSKGHPRRGRTVGQAFTQWLHDSGAERELMGGWAVGRLAVLHALLALPSGLHSTPLGIIAAGLLNDDVDIETALHAFAQDKPFASLQVREALERYAPNLADVWAGAMRRGEDSTHQRVLDDRPRRPNRPRSPEQTFDDSANILAALMRFGLMLFGLYCINTTCDSKPPPMSDSARAALTENLKAARIRRLAQPLPDPRGEGTPFWRRLYPSHSPKAASKPAAVQSAPRIDWSTHPKWLKTFCEPDAGSKCARAQGMWAAFKAGKCAVAKQRYAWLSSDMMLTPKMHAALKVGGRTIKAKCAASP